MSRNFPKRSFCRHVAGNTSRVGLLALQGAFDAHGRLLRTLGAETTEVRLPAQLDDIDALVLPGGESTTLLKLIDAFAFEEPLRAFVQSGRPVLATCMGVILLAENVTNPPQRSFGLLPVDVERNSYGRQVESFEARSSFAGETFDLVFIRAPRITRTGPGVETLLEHGGDPVLVRHGNILAATFHPELGECTAIHRLFLEMAKQSGRLSRARTGA
ncbi:MAG: pyridoxal 5'-phosphate synthase glutaminase subunit PdxT [Gemmatimonadetes bacterium]|nr:pyridoxal 5'-phosphate synthase glutaminase subunit PdxT [Gemmatimonadota bacterium]